LRRSRGLDEKEDLVILTGLPLSTRIFTMRPATSELDLVHELHRFDDAQDLLRLDDLAHLDVRFGVRRGRAVEVPTIGDFIS